MAEQISAKLARELIRDGDTARLRDDPHAVDELNQSVIKEFRANQGRVGGPLKNWPILLLTMTGAKTGRTLVRPLCYSRDGDSIVIIASYGGAPRNPPWYYFRLFPVLPSSAQANRRQNRSAIHKPPRFRLEDCATAARRAPKERAFLPIRRPMRRSRARLLSLL